MGYKRGEIPQNLSRRYFITGFIRIKIILLNIVFIELDILPFADIAHYLQY